MFKGSIPALITPFKNGDIDWDAFENFVEWQIEHGSHAVVPCGTTGESPTLTHEEHRQVVERCVKIVDGRIPVIAGAGSNSTHEAIELTQHAKKAGADAALVVTPYYNKPTQDGIYAHFKAVHDAADLPIVVYNVPGRTIVDVSNETLTRLAKLTNIVGVKDATNDLGRVPLLRQMIDKEFCYLSGEDSTICGYLAQGGDGIISVLANAAPALSAQMHNAWRLRDMNVFEMLRDKLMPLADALFLEPNPVPVNYAVSKLGLCENNVRLPLLPASETTQQAVDKALAHAGIQ